MRCILHAAAMLAALTAMVGSTACRCGSNGHTDDEVAESARSEKPSLHPERAEANGPDSLGAQEGSSVAEPSPEDSDPDAWVVIDTHIDTTQRMLDDNEDPIASLVGGHLDVPRMRAGGLSGAFFSIFVNPSKFAPARRWERSLALARRVIAFTVVHPEQTQLCRTATEVRAAVRAQKVAVLMGVEGAQGLGSDDPEQVIERLRELYRMGSRYMTITWSTDNALGHSSAGDAPEKGLTELGARVIREMNRLGMIVDVSHVSDRTFWDILEITEQPVIASHSSARALAEHPRNLSDAMIRKVAAGGGAVCVNFYNRFIDSGYATRRAKLEWRHRARFRAIEEGEGTWLEQGQRAFALAQELDPELAPPTVSTIADHVAHIVELGGPSAACLGSDFDGVPELPIGMSDVSELGALREELMKRQLPVRAILGENVLRVLATVGRERQRAEEAR